MPKKHIKTCLIPFFIREIKIKNKMKYYFTPNRMARILEYEKKKKKCSTSKDVKRLEPPFIICGSVKWFNHYAKDFDNSSKLQHRVTM